MNEITSIRVDDVFCVFCHAPRAFPSSIGLAHWDFETCWNRHSQQQHGSKTIEARRVHHLQAKASQSQRKPNTQNLNPTNSQATNPQNETNSIAIINSFARSIPVEQARKTRSRLVRF